MVTGDIAIERCFVFLATLKASRSYVFILCGWNPPLLSTADTTKITAFCEPLLDNPNPRVTPFCERPERQKAVFQTQMNLKHPQMIFPFRQRFLLRAINLSAISFLICVPADAHIISSEVIHRDFDSAIQRSIYEDRGEDDTAVFRTNQFTVLENNMHYFENGEWKSSEDVLEPFPGGVIGRRGPNRAIFSPSLNSPAVFDILTRNGGRVRGGVRSILATDFSTGESVVLATVREDARAELLDQDKVLFADAFEGSLRASVIYIWRHNLFCQEVVLLEKPVLPGDFNSDTVRLEIVTEFLGTNPRLIEQEVPFGPNVRLSDNPTISFGDLAIVTGSAFPFDADRVGTIEPGENSTRVTKEWQKRDDNSSILIESVPWSEMVLHLNQLPESQAMATPPTKRESALASARIKSDAEPSLPTSSEVQVASAFRPMGYVIDFTTLPDSPLTTTFLSTETYYIPASYYSGSAVTFQSGTVVKYKNNANILLYGSVNFPSATPRAIFTSRDDDVFGQKIVNVAGESDSDGNPTDHQASKAIWIYYVNFNTTIRNAQIRWAQTGVRYDQSSGVTATHTIQNSVFEHSTNGLYINIPSGTGVTLNNVRGCGVTSVANGYYSGTMTTDCGVVNASKNANHQAEPAIAVRQNPSDPTKVQIVIVAMYAGSYPSQTMLQMVSNDSGASWTTSTLSSAIGMATPETDSDPSLAFDDWGNLFLVYRATVGGSVKTVLYVSTNGGTSWTNISSFNGNNGAGAAPKVATGPKIGNPQKSSVWVSMHTDGVGIFATGTEVTGLGTISSSWTSQTALLNSSSAHFHSIAVGPNGEVTVAFIDRGSAPYAAPLTCRTAYDNDGLSSGGFNTGGTFAVNLGYEFIAASGTVTPVFPVPVLSWHRSSNKLYLALTDKTTASGESDDDTDIYVRVSGDKAQNWSGRVKVNDNVGAVNTIASQFHPWLAVDQASGYVSVAWYDCRKDSGNVKTHFYAAVSRDQFATSQPRNFQINPSQSNAPAVGLGGGSYKEYVGHAFFKGYLHPVWIDNSNSTGDNPDGTSAFDVYTARVPY